LIRRRKQSNYISAECLSLKQARSTITRRRPVMDEMLADISARDALTSALTATDAGCMQRHRHLSNYSLIVGSAWTRFF